jgi:hypothetical protein
VAKAYEISVWKPHAGKMGEFLKRFGDVKQIFLDEGVSQIDVLTGVAGKDVSHVVVIQTFKSLSDNGAVNDAIGNSAAMKDLMEKNKDINIADLVSHDLYQGTE